MGFSSPAVHKQHPRACLSQRVPHETPYGGGGQWLCGPVDQQTKTYPGALGQLICVLLGVPTSPAS